MNPLTKARNVWRGLVQSWGTSAMKRALWNKEFAAGRWRFIEHTADDPIYSLLEKYCGGGCLLDLGCGTGNTGCELRADAYVSYTGVDISDVALQTARERSRQLGRADKNRFCQADIAEFNPDTEYDVILFRESIYYIPRVKLLPLLERYAQWLKPRGVFIVRWDNRQDAEAFARTLPPRFELLDRSAGGPGAPLILAFRPFATGQGQPGTAPCEPASYYSGTK